jgi:Asp-tRNA(Asn)/Glu-tRNA(Gln) amidotransferase A subunit family amidase
MDATETAARIRAGDLTAVEVAADALERARADRYNAFTVVTDELARTCAEAVDAGQRRGPLAGVPITVKDHVWLAGQPATNGSRALRDFVPAQSAVCVDRLLAAGAVVIGKTNNPEFCYRGVTDNELWGTTVNPRDPTRTPGGSSGGAAASVAAGVVPLAVGTDGGGSIRIPSAFCGVYGLKPSFGVVPKMPGFRGWPTLSVTGPVAASVRDLALALAVMAGPHPADWLSSPSVRADDQGPLRIGVCADLAPVDDDVRAAFDAAVARLPGTVAVDVPRDDGLAVWDAVALPEGYASEGAVVQAHPDLVGADAAGITLAGKDFSARDYLDAQEARGDYAAKWAAVFADVDALLMPAMPTTAFGVGRLRPDSIAGEPVRDGFDTWCALAVPANLAGLPAVSVPIGAGRAGLPVGAQVLAARWHDSTALRVAALLDDALAGHPTESPGERGDSARTPTTP